MNGFSAEGQTYKTDIQTTAIFQNRYRIDSIISVGLAAVFIIATSMCVIVHHFLICRFLRSLRSMITFYASFIDSAFDYILMFSQSLEIFHRFLFLPRFNQKIWSCRIDSTSPWLEGSRQAMQIMSHFSLHILAVSNSFRFQFFFFSSHPSFASHSLRIRW